MKCRHLSCLCHTGSEYAIDRIAGEMCIQSRKSFLVDHIAVENQRRQLRKTMRGTEVILDVESRRHFRFGRLHDPIADTSPMSLSLSASTSMLLPFNVWTIRRKDSLPRLSQRSFSLGAFIRNGSIDCTVCTESLDSLSNRVNERLPLSPSNSASIEFLPVERIAM
mmetsp:Transcript_16367/g.36645  ORF Transcript_16367/g.36645 Transcript_16367/m.36645 type:complete len:166 (-) Transcript_16367:74-571(-)